jgi:hypothetical protein
MVYVKSALPKRVLIIENKYPKDLLVRLPYTVVYIVHGFGSIQKSNADPK